MRGWMGPGVRVIRCGVGWADAGGGGGGWWCGGCI